MRFTTILDEERGVSPVIGFILVFAVGIMLLGLLQVTAVPLSNEEAEFEHSQTVTDQFLELRSASLTAVEDAEIRSTTVTLGTRYPNRFILLNPPPASGTLRTTSPKEITSTGFSPADRCGLENNPHSRTMLYQANYNVFQQNPELAFEHGASVRKFEDGSVIVDGKQWLVSGNDITLLPLVDDYYESGVQARSIDVASPGMGAFKEIDGPFNITVPSELDAETWESNENLLKDEIDQGTVGDVVENNDGTITIEFVADTYRVRCGVLGIDESPSAEPPNQEDGGEDESPNVLNPTSGNVLQYEETRKAGGQSDWSASFHNLNDDGPTLVHRVRIASASTSGLREGSYNFTRNDITVENLEPGGDFKDVEPAWSWDADTTGDIVIDASLGQGAQPGPNDQMTIQFVYTDGTIREYEIWLTKSN